MTNKRNRFGRSDMANIKAAQMRAKKRAPAPTKRTERVRNFIPLQMMLLIFLPLMFLVGLFLQNNLVFLIFSILSLVTLIITWLLSAFAPNPRATLSVIHIAMVMIAVFAVIIQPTKLPEQQAPSISEAPSINQINTQANIVQNNPIVPPTQTPVPVTEAVKSLENFLNAWRNVDYTGMAATSLPSWLATQRNSADTAMFHLRANRSTNDWEVLEISGSDSDQARTVNLNILIDRNNGDKPQWHRFQILMRKEEGKWFVDPASISSLGVLPDPNATQPPIPATIVPTATPDPNMILYYNPDGGSFYHKNPSCPSLATKYVPLTHSFRFPEINNPPYNQLNPCITCKAPSR